MPKAIPTEIRARIVAEARQFGYKAAAERNGVSTRAVHRFMRRATTDQALGALVEEKADVLVEAIESDADWVANAKRFMRRSIAKLEELVQQAQPEKGAIHEVAGAIKIVGELDVVRSALQDGEQPERPGAGAAPSGSEGEAPGGYLQ